MKPPPNIAVIGSGYWGKNLVRNYYELGALKLICDKNPVLLDQYKNQYPDVETCLSLHDVISRDDIRGLVIATPAETHYTLAREALLAGKHVYVEKPLVLDETQGQALIELASGNNRTLMVGHLLQYHPAFVRLKELALSGELGRVNYIYSHRLNLGKIRREENILWSFAPHDISMILALACEMPETVSATGGNYLHRQIADVTTTHLEFSSGLRAHIFVSWLHPYKEQKLVVVGDKKMAVFDDTLVWPDKLLLYAHKIKWHNNVPVPEKREPERVEISEAEPLRVECEHFLHSFTNENRPQTDGEEGLRVLKILNAAQRSLNTNGCKVELRTITATPPFKTQHSKFKIDPDTGIQSPVLPDTRNLKPETFFAHESAFIDENVEIGSGSKIWHFSHILKNSTIGETCTIGQNVVIGPDVCIGNQCKIQNNVSVYKGVTIEDGVFCGPSMVFTNIYNPRARIVKMDQVRPTRVREGATLGANCTIVCGTTIGRYAFVGAGALVNKNVPDHALVVGNPARQIGWVCECGERLTDDLECMACSKTYQKQENAGLIEKS
jgi:UDP-2-acetamido-3-amino-2,3-dideoxy-glucuronate N-acetyltransferase